MKRAFPLLLLLTVTARAIPQPEDGIIPGQVLIQWAPGTDAESFMRDFRARHPEVRLHYASNVSTAMNISLLESRNRTQVPESWLNQLQEEPAVLNVQYNHRIHYRATPNDSLFSNQWSLLNTGQNGGLPDADIDATDAWDIVTGGLTSAGDTIVIAIIDGGVDMNHEDLAENLWINRFEIPANQADDDTNGYVDDYHGWNFFDNNDTLDPDWHGTAVTGIAGAVGNNQIGVSGINWSVKILPVEAGVSEAQAIEAYSYVWEFRKRYNATNGQEGAFVVAINSSWGIDLGQPADYPLWCAIYDSMGKDGILNCAATANHDWDIDVMGDMPTACPSPWLISVTNTTRNDAKENLAGYGDTTIDLGAPGTQTYTTMPANGYGFFGGTSGATPNVTGAIALLYATTCPELMQDARLYPDSVALLVKQMILYGVDTLADLTGRTVSGGRLNVYKSLVLAQNYGTCIWTGLPRKNPVPGFRLTPNPATESVQITWPRQFSISQWQLIALNGQLLRISALPVDSFRATISLTDLPPGMYFIRLVSSTGKAVTGRFMKL